MVNDFVKFLLHNSNTSLSKILLISLTIDSCMIQLSFFHPSGEMSLAMSFEMWNVIWNVIKGVYYKTRNVTWNNLLKCHFIGIRNIIWNVTWNVRSIWNIITVKGLTIRLNRLNCFISFILVFRVSLIENYVQNWPSLKQRYIPHLRIHLLCTPSVSCFDLIDYFVILICSVCWLTASQSLVSTYSALCLNVT